MYYRILCVALLSFCLFADAQAQAVFVSSPSGITGPVDLRIGSSGERAAPGEATGDAVLLPIANGTPFRAEIPHLPAAPVAWKSAPVIAAAPSLSRHLVVGGAIGGALGAAFGLAVVSFADCTGPECTEERVVGVVGHALAGVAVGAVIGGIIYLIRS